MQVKVGNRGSINTALIFRFRVDPSKKDLKNYLRSHHQLSLTDFEFLVNHRIPPMLQPGPPIGPLPTSGEIIPLVLNCLKYLFS